MGGDKKRRENSYTNIRTYPGAVYKYQAWTSKSNLKCCVHNLHQLNLSNHIWRLFINKEEWLSQHTVGVDLFGIPPYLRPLFTPLSLLAYLTRHVLLGDKHSPQINLQSKFKTSFRAMAHPPKSLSTAFFWECQMLYFAPGTNQQYCLLRPRAAEAEAEAAAATTTTISKLLSDLPQSEQTIITESY